MLKFYDSPYDAINCESYYIKELASGIDELIFTISINDPAYTYIQEETRITESALYGNDLYYLVKAIDAGEKTATIKCQADLSDWRGNIYWGFAMEDTFANVVRHVLPTGWSFNDSSGDTSTHRVELTACTRLEAIQKCEQLWPNLTLLFNTGLKFCGLENMNNGANRGAVVSREMNLRKLNYKGKSTNFATRLYPMGKDGLKITDVNGGLDYIENLTYVNKIICASWIDESIEDATELLAAAQEVLAEISTPQRSYECDVVDLAKALQGDYTWLSFDLFNKVTLIDDTRGYQKLTYKVVEKWSYPYMPNKNKIVLSSAAPRIQTQVTQVTTSVSNINSAWMTQLNSIISQAILSTLGFSGGIVRIRDLDSDGYLDTIDIADNADPASAQKIIRINKFGILKTSGGYSGTFSTLLYWAGSYVSLYLDNVRLLEGIDQYVPKQIAYLDGNGTAQTETILAKQ